MTLSSDLWNQLEDAARDVATLAYAPYSHFHVGAALLASNQAIYAGCNVENATYGATSCAERSAFGNAVSSGIQTFRALAVFASTEHPAAPCGICRQVISEFCEDDFPILLIGSGDKRRFTTLGELLPFRFSGSDFGFGTNNK